MKPKVPETCMISEEGDIPHICVSTSVYHCMRSIISVKNKDYNVLNVLETCRQNLQAMESIDDWIARGELLKSPTVYKSEEKAFAPPNASDFRQNKEHWYLKKTKFDLLGFIDLEELIKTGKLKIVSNYHEIDGKHILDLSYKKLMIKK